MASNDRVIKWKVVNGVTPANLETELNNLSNLRWTVEHVVAMGSSFSIVSWQWQIEP